MDYTKTTGALLLTVTVLVTVILQMAHWIDIVNNVTDIWIWIVAAVIGVSSNLITKTRQQQRENQKEPTQRNLGIERNEKVWKDSLDFIPFYHAVNEAEDILKKSKKDFWVMGTTSAYWSEVKRNEVIEAILERGISCKFLLSKPDSDFIEVSKQEGIIGAETNKEEIQQSVDYFLKHLKNNPELIESNLQDRIEIRTFNLPFLFSIALSDPYDENGVAYAEPYCYVTPKGDRFLLVIKRSDQPKLFELYRKSFEHAWKRATPAQWLLL